MRPCQHFCLICSFGSCRIYLLGFFCGVFSLLLLGGGDFAIEDGASPEGVTESAGSCSSGIADGGIIGAIVKYWITYCHLTGLLEISQELAVKIASVQWWYIEVWCHAVSSEPFWAFRLGLVSSVALVVDNPVWIRWGILGLDISWFPLIGTVISKPDGSAAWGGRCCYPALISSNVLSA